jgi:hypothetical protein
MDQRELNDLTAQPIETLTADERKAIIVSEYKGKFPWKIPFNDWPNQNHYPLIDGVNGFLTGDVVSQTDDDFDWQWLIWSDGGLAIDMQDASTHRWFIEDYEEFAYPPKWSTNGGGKRYWKLWAARMKAYQRAKQQAKETK